MSASWGVGGVTDREDTWQCLFVLLIDQSGQRSREKLTDWSKSYIVLFINWCLFSIIPW